ncbi:MAG TPA: DUF1330 domain-containing protein [Myxococcota bacterium]|nr:DUF1330 domain-containing protein [Myxococcota bacterium]
MLIAQYPTPEQIQELLRGPADVPVVMVNLLRFKERAGGPDEGISGVEAYRRYGEPMRRIVEERGGRFLWMGRIDSFVIGASDTPFDAVALVEYPSRRVFLEIVNDPRVRAIGAHRAAGLEGQWLIATTAGQI